MTRPPLATALLLIVPWLLLAGSTQPTRVLNDGFTHILDADKSFPLDVVAVDDGPDGPTRVELRFRGEVSALEARGRSEIKVTGGRIRRDLEGSGSAVLEVSGGVIGDDLQLEGSAELDMSGGSITKDLEAAEQSRLNLSGGVVGDDLQASGRAQVRVSGGEIRDTLVAEDASVVTLVGSGFNYAVGDLFPLSGRIEGSLSDGTRLDLRFRRGHGARIRLEEAGGAPPASLPPRVELPQVR